MVKALVLTVIASVSHSALAQPGLAPAYRPLSPDDQHALDIGEIGDGQQILGVVLAGLPGFGLGQAAQGRWSDRGWIFTLGESASLAMFAFAAECPLSSAPRGAGNVCGDSQGYYDLAVASVISLLVFHTAGLIDAVITPSIHNRRVRRLKAQLGAPLVYVAPSGGGGIAGITLRF